jgi:hypothetical protein
VLQVGLLGELDHDVRKALGRSRASARLRSRIKLGTFNRRK